MENLRNETVQQVRSVLISTKEKVSLKKLNFEYHGMIGQPIPFRELGFRTLEDFINSEPQAFRLIRGGNEYYVTATESEKSSHITEMVAKQKFAKKKATKVKFVRYDHHPPPRFRPTQQWRPIANATIKHFQGSARPKAVNHYQLVNRATVASKVVIPEHSTFNSDKVGKKPEMNQRLTSDRVRDNVRRQISGEPENGTASNSHNYPAKGSSSRQNQYYKESQDTVNPSISARKRITKMMSEISLESTKFVCRDSGNSSPTSDILPPSPAKTPEFTKTGDPLADLKLFADLHKLGEVTYSTAKIGAKRLQFYSCKVKVGTSYTYSSYPNEFSTEKEALNFCAADALKDLLLKCRRKSDLMVSSEKDIISRIPPMLEKHYHGIWAWQLKLDYSEKFNELLPDDWLQIIDSSQSVHIEKASSDHILYHCRPSDKGQQRNEAVLLANVSVPSNTAQFGEEGKLYGHVTCVVSANEVWCQQLGTEETKKYTKMIERLQLYYVEHEHLLRPTTVSPSSYYIAKYDGAYYRARAVKIGEAHVDCFFIDWGDLMTIPRTDIFDLKREYATAQAQAFVCRLYGLEDLYDVSYYSQNLQCLYEKEVVLELVEDSATSEFQSEAFPVLMYDSTTGKSINEELIPLLTMELATPILQPDGVTEVYVSNIESNGDLYVQVRSQGYKNLTKLKEQIDTEMNTAPKKDILRKVTRQNSQQKLFYIKYEDGEWYRVQLIDWAPTEDYAQIYFVDHGHTSVIRVNQEELYPLEALNEVFNNYPRQAVKVRTILNGIPKNFVELATKEMPKDQLVLLKLIKTVEGVPLVKLFKRNLDGGLFCINESIALASELEIKAKKEENNPLVKFKISQLGILDCVPSTGALKCPHLPELNNFFDVFIPVAINPYNFFVQPLESKEQLNSLMEKLQKRYQNVHYGNLKVDDVQPGKIYASKHDDGFWYRTSVIKVIHSGSVSVFYCDFGYYQTLSVKQLLPLDEEYMELPYQALKAKLSGIKPVQNKWTMQDCEDFKLLIQKKCFVAFFVNIEKDILYESDLVLKLILVDTSNDDDLYIGQELIKRGIAVEET